jgi:putative membrane protein
VAWGRVVSHCRNVQRQSSLWINDDVSRGHAPDENERRAVLHELRWGGAR